jgi:L-cysteine/cystine lyase
VDESAQSCDRSSARHWFSIDTHSLQVESELCPLRGAVRIPPVTFEEARAQFPVLEKLAYLQAGSCGPLARATSEAMRAEEERDLVQGRAGQAYIDRVLALRAEVREALAGLVGVTPEQVALTASTTDSCNIILAGLDLGPEDEVVTTTDEHFGLIGPLHASSARVVVSPPDPDGIVAAITPRTRLVAVSQVLWTTGQILPVHELRERTGIPILVDGAQSVGAIPVDASGLDFFTISGQKWLCGPESTGALVVAEPERLRVARPSYFAQKRYDPDGTFEPWPGARRFDPNWVPVAFMSGLLAALGCRPEWGFERALDTAERLHSLLVDAGEDVVTPTERATLVSWRPAEEETAAVVERLYDAGVVVRDLPGTGLVRASVGWWTSDEDLSRLVAALGRV